MGFFVGKIDMSHIELITLVYWSLSFIHHAFTKPNKRGLKTTPQKYKRQ